MEIHFTGGMQADVRHMADMKVAGFDLNVSHANQWHSPNDAAYFLKDSNPVHPAVKQDILSASAAAHFRNGSVRFAACTVPFSNFVYSLHLPARMLAGHQGRARPLDMFIQRQEQRQVPLPACLRRNTLRRRKQLPPAPGSGICTIRTLRTTVPRAPSGQLPVPPAPPQQGLAMKADRGSAGFGVARA